MVVLTTGEQLAEDREAIDRLLNAQKQAIDMLETQPQNAAELLVTRFIAEEKLADEAGRKAAIDVVAKALEGQTFSWAVTESDVQRMEEIVDIMVDQKILETEIDVKPLLDLAWQQKQS